MTCCKYCGKPRCKHVGPDDEQQHQRPTPTRADTPQPTRDRSLFELHDLNSLLCVVCGHVIAPGRDQVYLRAHHGQQHVHDGTAVADRRGLPEGAVRYLVK